MTRHGTIALQTNALLCRKVVRQDTNYGFPLDYHANAGNYPPLAQTFSRRLPPAKGICRHELKLFWYETFVRTEDVVSDMREQGFRPADAWVAFTFCRRNPEVQVRKRVIPLGTYFRHGGSQRDIVLAFGWKNFLERMPWRVSPAERRERALDFVPEYGGFEPVLYAFLGMREYSIDIMKTVLVG